MSRPIDPTLRSKLLEQATNVLQQNDLGDSTKPAPHLYPHQWLWDSCFIAIGLRHLDPDRARREIMSLFRGQWQNGMIPHEIFNSGIAYHAGPDRWGSKGLKFAPKEVDTSCMTQPPMIAEAVVRVGEKLSHSECKSFYESVLPGLVRYHTWLYRERDPYHTGLVALIHPWESGAEDIAYWSHLLRGVAPWHQKALTRLGQEQFLDRFRADLKHAPANQRPTTSDFMALYRLMDIVRSRRYDFSRVLPLARVPLVYDVLFNAILVRANHHLATISSELGKELPPTLQASISQAPKAFATLFDHDQYWSRDLRTGRLLEYPSAAGFLGLYAGTVPQSHADSLARKLESPDFWPRFGITSTPTNSPDYRPRAFWRGPVWLNLNWLVADGLDRYSHTDLATRLRRNSIELVAHASGMYENFSAETGEPGGTANFSWTAALIIDILQQP